MAERRPIYNAHVAGQQLGYIEDDEVFDLFDRPCAIYDNNTGLLRDLKNNAVVGYVSLADIFVGASWVTQELFFQTEPVTPQASLEEVEDEVSEVPVCGAEDGNAENVDAVRFIAQAPPSHHTAKTDLSVMSTPIYSEKASVEDQASLATDITGFTSSSQKGGVIGTVLPPPPSLHLGNSSIEQPARPQDASDAAERGEPGSYYPSRAMDETAPALQPDANASVLMPTPSDESAFESGRHDEPSGKGGIPPAVEAFMRHLTEYLHSSNGTQSSDDAAELKLSPSADTQKDTDRLPFPGEPDPEG